MKRKELETYLRSRGCSFVSHGRKHDLWMNPLSFQQTTLPRHNEIKYGTVRGICRVLGVEPPAGR